MSETADYQPFDLIGDPVDPNHGARGRRTHKPTDEKRRLVIALVGFGRSMEEIAAALSITPPTLRRHYKKQLIEKEKARMRLEGKLVDRMLAAIEDGKVSAMKELHKMLFDIRLQELAASVKNRPGDEAVKAAVGKKEQQAEAARGVEGLYAPPPAPNLVN